MQCDAMQQLLGVGMQAGTHSPSTGPRERAWGQRNEAPKGANRRSNTGKRETQKGNKKSLSFEQDGKTRKMEGGREQGRER